MKNKDNRFSLLLIRWKEIKEDLSLIFEKREVGKAQPLMKEAISIFHELLAISNENRLSEYAELHWKPVNLIDRIMFINKRINSYHAFIQLSELFNEQEKIYEKSLIIKK
ncbi:YpoC family protein [Pseudoneobacillus sp. C159]